MEKIKEIKKPIFRLVINSDHHSYHEKVLNIITYDFAKKYSMENHLMVYETLFKKEGEALVRTRSFEETKDIRTIVTKRDEVFFFIRRIIEGMNYNPDAEFKNAAKVLDNVLEPYRYTNRKSLQENISEIDTFIKKLEANEVLLEAIKLLDLIRPLDILKTANISLKELYDERSSKRYVRKTQDSFVKLRPQVNKALFEIIKFINAVYLVSNEITKEKSVTDELGIIIDKINSVTAKMINSASKQKTKKNNKGNK